MRHLTLFLPFLLFLLPGSAAAQCYKTFLDEGKDLVRRDQWDQAIEAFENGKRCQADKPANGNATLNTLIADARQKKQDALERKKQEIAEAQRSEQEAACKREQDRLRNEATAREDDSAWDIAQATQVTAACQRYLDKYPAGRHTVAAQQCVKDYSDSDGDGVLNKNDRCPDIPGSASNGGCKEDKKPDLIAPSDMVPVQGGTFWMGSEYSSSGSSDERPLHRVTVSSFYLSKYEVTVAEFKKFVDDTGYKTTAEKEGTSIVAWTSEYARNGVNWHHNVQGNVRLASEYNHPVIHVSWNDATEYCKWLSQKMGKTYRLPTEAEWEYAAGGGDPNTVDRTLWAGTSYSGYLNRYTNFSTSTRGDTTDPYEYTAPVGSFKPNQLGLYDMSGNVWEWCSDWYDDDYRDSEETNPTGPISESTTYSGGKTYSFGRVLRGGGWNKGDEESRSTNRENKEPSYRNGAIGFRIASPSQ